MDSSTPNLQSQPRTTNQSTHSHLKNAFCPKLNLLLVRHYLLLLLTSHLHDWHYRLPGGPSQTKAKKPRMTPPLSISYQLHLSPSVFITQIHILLFIPIVPDPVQSLIISSWKCFNHLLSKLPASPVASHLHCCWSDGLKP